MPSIVVAVVCTSVDTSLRHNDSLLSASPYALTNVQCPENGETNSPSTSTFVSALTMSNNHADGLNRSNSAVGLTNPASTDSASGTGCVRCRVGSSIIARSKDCDPLVPPPATRRPPLPQPPDP